MSGSAIHSGMSHEILLLVFARAPRLGAVKSRLIPALGEQAALAIHQRLLERTLVEAAAFPGDAHLMLDQPDETLTRRAASLGLGVGLQQGTDLGERMENALRQGLNDYRKVLLVGSDCPVLDQAYLALAGEALVRGRVVVGASEDGGYVLIGGGDAAVWTGGRFRDVRMGTGYALSDTREALNDVAGVTVLPPLWDVDRPEDVRRARILGILP